MLLNLLILLLGLNISIPSAFGQEDDEAYREKILREFSQPANEVNLDEIIEDDQAQIEEVIETPQATPVKIKDSYLTKVMNNAAKQFLGQFLAENPFSRMSHEELKSYLLKSLGDQPVGNALERNPKLLNMSVEILRDKRALPAVIGLVNKPEKVQKYGIVVIVVFVLVFIFNLMNSKGNIFKRILMKMSIGLVAFSVNIGAAFYIFNEELSPMLDIVFKYYHF